MTAEPLSAHSPKYADFYGTAVDLLLDHPELGEIPFTAHEEDTEPMGEDLYARALAGEFGDIAPYDGPDPNSPEVLAEQVRSQRNQKLAQLDMLVMNPLRWASYTPEQQAELAAYRQALLDVPQQPGFTQTLDWPQMPVFILKE